MLFGGIAQRIADRAGLDHRGAVGRVDGQHPVQVFAGVDDHGDVDALAVLRRAAAARQDGHAVFAADVQRGVDVFDAARDLHADRNLAVVGGVRRVEGARAGIKTDFAGDAAG